MKQLDQSETSEFLLAATDAAVLARQTAAVHLSQ